MSLIVVYDELQLSVVRQHEAYTPFSLFFRHLRATVTF